MSVFTHTIHAYNEQTEELRTQDIQVDLIEEARTTAEAYAQEQGPEWQPIVRVFKKVAE